MLLPANLDLIQFFSQLNYQRDQVAAIKEKQKRKEDKEDASLPKEKPFSAAATETSLAQSTIIGMAGSCIIKYFNSFHSQG